MLSRSDVIMVTAAVVVIVLLALLANALWG
jgi:hypothetical protein